MGCAMIRQLQTWLCLKASHQPGGRDLLRKLSQVHHREVEVLHSQGKNKCGAWLVAEGLRCLQSFVQEVGACSLRFLSL